VHVLTSTKLRDIIQSVRPMVVCLLCGLGGIASGPSTSPLNNVPRPLLCQSTRQLLNNMDTLATRVVLGNGTCELLGPSEDTFAVLFTTSTARCQFSRVLDSPSSPLARVLRLWPRTSYNAWVFLCRQYDACPDRVCCVSLREQFWPHACPRVGPGVPWCEEP
jgi:hypothetical protein